MELGNDARENWQRLHWKLERSFKHTQKVRIYIYESVEFTVANTIGRVIHERIATALIIEDDVDWDVELKSQMRAILGMIDTLDFAKDWE